MQKNPWLEIPYTDYEQHMAHPTVRQLQALNEITKILLEKIQPKVFALLGCSTGNGLEHIDGEATKVVHCIDINSEFLEITAKRHKKIKNLLLHHLDINKDELSFRNIDLFHTALVLEYVDVKDTLKKLCQSLSQKGYLSIVIQKSKKKNTSFVSNTPYKSLEQLGSISKEIEEQTVQKLLMEQKLDLVELQEVKLNEYKSFIWMIFKKK